jgi:NAD(P)-dependent dehydrogenase (short-subunit alcohol dehydrogenase family)
MIIERINRMELGIKDKKALVTGGSAGIGKAAAKALAGEKVQVAIVARDLEKLKKTATEIHEATGQQVLPIPFDLTEDEKIESMIDQVASELGGLDILVNNAGASRFGDPMTIDAEAFKEAMDLKYFGYVNCSRAAAKHMIPNGWGRIINVIGVGGKRVNILHLPGGSANAALVLFTKGLSLHLAPHGVLVNAVSPGGVATERYVRLVQSNSHARGVTYSEAEKQYIKDYPIGRIARPEEVADVILFLASSRASYFVGSNVIMDGGSLRAT